MAATNLTELQQVVEALQVEVGLLRANMTSSIAGTTTVTDQLASFSTDMDTLWLLLGSTLVVCESLTKKKMVHRRCVSV